MEDIRPSAQIKEEHPLIVPPEDIEFKQDVVPPDIEGGYGNYDSEVAARLTLYDLKNLFYDDPWVYIACNLIGRKISRQFMPIYKKIIKRGQLVEDLAPAHPGNDRMVEPNGFEDYHSFMYRVAVELCLMGNAIIWKLRFHDELVLLPTELVTMNFDEGNKLISYQIDASGQGELAGLNGTMTFNPEDIIHVKIPNPNSMLWGLSAWIPGRRSVLFDRYSQEYLLNFYLKQANPGPVMEMGEISEINGASLDW
jgi:phage portal protein BeeE